MSHEQDVIDKKIRFAKESILPFFLKKHNKEQISEQNKDSVVEKIAGINIFPYITEAGIKYGKLKDSGISWYYCESQQGKGIYSTDSYRIFASSEYPPDLFSQIRAVFGAEGSEHLQKYSEEVVIKDLIHRMEKGKYYSDAWWNYACDAFERWDPKSDPGTTYQNATKGIQEAYFLYDDEKFLPEYQELMDRFKVYKDIRKTKGFGLYIERNKGKKQDKIRFLKYLGVPSSFIERGTFGASCLTVPVKALLESIEKLIYPVGKTDGNNYERCKLAEYIVLHVIYEENQYFAENLIKDKRLARSIPVLNVNKQYVRASQCLFYIGDSEISHIPDNSLNYMLIDRDYGQDLKKDIAKEIESVRRYEDYSLSGVLELMFYKWVWQYTHNDDLVQSILLCFNKLEKVGISYSAFAFDVLDNTCIKETDGEGNETVILKNRKNLPYLRFTIHTIVEKIIQYRNLLNALYRNTGYRVSITLSDGDIEKAGSWTKDVKNRIVDSAYNTNRENFNKIDKDTMWNNIYTVNSPEMETDTFGQYIAVHYNNSKRILQDNMIIVVKNSNINSYITALCTYIKDHLGIILTGVTTNWSEQYKELFEGIRDFLMKKEPLVSDEELSFMTSDMADIKTLGIEIATWKQIKEQKDSILKNRVIDSDFNTWKQFLDSKYHGRCQLCGNKTVSGRDQAYTWTYRMVKQRENSLANMECNMFCLCPSCHGEMSYGFKGRDLTKILKTAEEYAVQLTECLEESPDDTEVSPSIISEFADYENDYEGFHAPVICEVLVNGEERQMKFSWEHFLRIAFLLTEGNDYNM